MTDNNYRVKENHSVSEAFIGGDYEIKPKMIEVWNGKRIAWAVAIISLLFLIPIVYFMYNNYWNSSQEQSQLTVVKKPASQDSRPQPSMLQKPPVVITAPNSITQTGAPSSQPMIDNKTRARLAQQSLEEVSANIVKPLSKTDDESIKNASEQMDALTAKIKSKTAAVMQKKNQTSDAVKKELGALNQQELPNSSASSTTASAPPMQAKPQQNTGHSLPTNSRRINNRGDVEQSRTKPENISKVDNTVIADPIDIEENQELDSDFYSKSEHVSRDQLVPAIRNLEPVGKDITTLTIKQGQSRHIVYFTEVQGLAGQNINYRWLREGQLVFSKQIAVTGDYTWRSYIKKLIKSSMTGNWTVELLDDQDNILSQKSFNVVEN